MPDIYENVPTEYGQVARENAVGFPIKQVEIGNGIFIHLEGKPFPLKGILRPEGIFAVNQVKRIVRGLLTMPQVFFTPHRCLKYITMVGWKAIAPHVIKYELLTQTAQGVHDFIEALGVGPTLDSSIDGFNLNENPSLAKVIAHIFEYDSAYRFRLMDLMSESRFLAETPVREMLRLKKIHKQRDYETMGKRLSILFNIAALALLWPPFRKRFRKSLEAIDIKKLQYDESDWYWALGRTDYQTGGLPYEVRLKMLESYI